MNSKLFMVHWKAIVLMGLIIVVSCSDTANTLTGRAAIAAKAVAAPPPTGSTPSNPTEVSPPSSGPWVQLVNGHLVYQQDAKGNQVPDFSHVGYGSGTQPIPQVPVQITLSPQANGDDTARIQQAIDTVSHHTPNTQGLRGAVLLQAGQYRIGGTLNIQTSGVVLRGANSGPNGTVLVAQGSPHTLVKVAGTGTWAIDGTSHHITDSYVPVGAFTFHVDSTAGLKVGDSIIVQRPTSAAWIHTLGMDQLPPRKDGRPIHQWIPGPGLNFDRTITAINNQQITIDAPLTNAIEQQYTNAIIWRYSFPGRISQVGIEDLSSDGQAFTTAPGYASGGYFNSEFAHIDAVENGWMQHVVFQHYGNGISLGSTAKWVTISNVQALNMGRVSVSAAPAAFSVDGQFNLVEQCQVTGSYMHAWVTQEWEAGPNVFTQCTATGEHMDAAPHQRWGTGTLFDDMSITGQFSLINRGNEGSGQGWSAANDVLWNCKTATYEVQSPPTAQNWAIGCTGKINTSPLFPGTQGYIDSPGQPVQPTSLYAEQLAERLHTPNR